MAHRARGARCVPAPTAGARADFIDSTPATKVTITLSNPPENVSALITCITVTGADSQPMDAPTMAPAHNGTNEVSQMDMVVTAAEAEPLSPAVRNAADWRLRPATENATVNDTSDVPVSTANHDTRRRSVATRSTRAASARYSMAFTGCTTTRSRPGATGSSPNTTSVPPWSLAAANDWRMPSVRRTLKDWASTTPPVFDNANPIWTGAVQPAASNRFNVPGPTMMLGTVAPAGVAKPAMPKRLMTPSMMNPNGAGSTDPVRSFSVAARSWVISAWPGATVTPLTPVSVATPPKWDARSVSSSSSCTATASLAGRVNAADVRPMVSGSASMSSRSSGCERASIRALPAVVNNTEGGTSTNSSMGPSCAFTRLSAPDAPTEANVKPSTTIAAPMPMATPAAAVSMWLPLPSPVRRTKRMA